jgi:pimeloyl-ACP methyl ester carboxylesterase
VMPAPLPLLVHGSGGDHRVWARQAARLAGAVAIDLPGHPDGAALTDLEALAEAVARGVESVPGERVLVGHSLGAAVSLEVARSRPGLLAGIVVVASGARLPVPDAVMASARDDFAGECDRLMAGFFADPAAPMTGPARAALEDVGRDTLLADYAACRTVDLRGRLGGVRIPVLVVAGADDPLTPPWLAEELARELPSASMVVVPGTRHMPMAEADVTVSGLVAAYMARLELTLGED